MIRSTTVSSTADSARIDPGRASHRIRVLLTAAASLVLVGVGVPAAQAADAATPTAIHIESARIPASCKHPAARLSGGVKDFGTTADGASRGSATLVSRTHSTAVPIRHPLFALQRGASSLGADEVVPISCDAGGVGWPDTIVLDERSGAILASVDLGPIADREHASVTAVSLRSNHFRAHWDAYDGAGFHLRHEAGTFTLRHGKLVASHLDLH